MHVLGLSTGRVWRDDHLLRRSVLVGRSSRCPLRLRRSRKPRVGCLSFYRAPAERLSHPLRRRDRSQFSRKATPEAQRICRGYVPSLFPSGVRTRREGPAVAGILGDEHGATASPKRSAVPTASASASLFSKWSPFSVSSLRPFPAMTGSANGSRVRFRCLCMTSPAMWERSKFG